MAKAKQPSASKALVLATREPALYKAIEQIAALASKFGENPEANVSTDNIDKAVEVVARVRAANNKLKELADAAKAEYKKKIAEIDAEAKVLAKRLDAADEAVADRIIALYKEVPEDGRAALDKRMDGSMGSSASVTYRSVAVEVVDADKVPDKFVREVPTRAQLVDTAAVAAAIKAGEQVPGVRVLPNYYLTTRAAEIIK